MNSVPAPLLLSIGVFAAVVTVGRWVLVRHTMIDRLINRIWTWELSGFLAGGIGAGLGAPVLGERLFMGCGLLAGASAIGFAMVLAGREPERARGDQRRYDTVAAIAAVSLLAELPVHDHLDWLHWPSVVWTAGSGATAMGGILIARTCVVEMLRADLSVWERMLYGTLFALAVYWFAGSVVGMVRTATGTPPTEPGARWVLVVLASFVVTTGLVTVRLVDVILARCAWDRASRRCRRLRPLWRDLTAAVPEVVLQHGPSDRDSASRLYRMSVELWDAVLHLKAYVPPDVAGERDLAVLMAHAHQVKMAGGGPSGAADVRLPGPVDRGSELSVLLDLARKWPSVRAASGAPALDGVDRLPVRRARLRESW
ncbi:MAB_1171c family putative transporter [Nocardia sp. CDC186]|uniref:MAB_1171c family putative transporter n=1 Tax=Nocardia implantans TaxID=3108168 RepID=A0ABU6AWU6_9NOCA|nr:MULTISPECIES: MAB_1171c family putative transporter [unclassified Nocardia]MBF6192867.1 hypothetical protein [Nocardia beijingensis]MEA3531415.1 MAB_1171c family putative transporter [Nocardia sp. CDC192]MEB3511763.1 MAB_1171c family putative transporter [Nocardia sp. CDC186]